jgi:hypothetical protein
VPRYTVGHICGHPFAHVADYRDQPREMQDLRRWHDWMHSQPCLSCSRPAGLIIAKTDPAGDRLVQAAMASMTRKRSMERAEKADKIPHSRFTTTPSSIFETAGITLKQAQVLEYLFLMPAGQATYRGIAHQFDTSPINIGRTAGALLRRGMVRRVGEQGVTVERAGWRLRVSYAAWDSWLTAEARQEAQGCAPAISG